MNIAEFVIGFNKVITRVHVSVVFKRKCGPTCRRMHTQAVQADMSAEGDIKDLDEYLADIMGQPFIKDCAQKIAVLLSGD